MHEYPVALPALHLPVRLHRPWASVGAAIAATFMLAVFSVLCFIGRLAAAADWDFGYWTFEVTTAQMVLGGLGAFIGTCAVGALIGAGCASAEAPPHALQRRVRIVGCGAGFVTAVALLVFTIPAGAFDPPKPDIAVLIGFLGMIALMASLLLFGLLVVAIMVTPVLVVRAARWLWRRYAPRFRRRFGAHPTRIRSAHRVAS